MTAGRRKNGLEESLVLYNTMLYITYDGTNYSGFQVQENAPTIQEAVERALSIIYKQPVRITGAGRTDAGVHARGQAANFMAPFFISENKLPCAVNVLLPPDIVITGARKVGGDFHARFDARRKLYSYTIDRAPFPQVFKRFYCWHLPGKLDLDLMEKAALRFEGTHDFKAFQVSGSGVTDTQRTLYRVELKNRPEEQLLTIYFEGSGFLYRMARLITGSLVRAGRGRLNLAEIDNALRGENNAASGPTSPAVGLCLEKIYYDHDL